MNVSISVVIPTYRRVALLGRCLSALVKQSFTRSYEIIVVADGQDEGTRRLVEFLDKDFIHYHELDRKRGPAAARNLGWKHAAGDLIVFTDDDCIPTTDFIEAYWRAYLLRAHGPTAFTGKVT